MARGDVVGAVETDKGVIDLECFETGTVAELVAGPGTRVDVGGVLALLDTEGEAATEAARAPAAAMRAAIAAAMSRAKREIPHYYLSLQMDFGAAVAWLERHDAAVEPAGRLLYPALVIKAVALATREVPGFSGFFREGRFEPAPEAHVGVAIALRGGGLIAPAILDAAAKPLDLLMAEFRDLVSRARTARLKSSELTAPTITVTSLGDVGVETVLPVIHPPQVAMVGVGSVVQRPWVVDGHVVARPVVTLALAGDHRVSDGRVGAQFLDRIRQKLDAPEAL